MLPNNIVHGEIPAIKQLYDLLQKYNAIVLRIETVARADCMA